MGSLDGKSILVTGGASGIGEATAVILAREGAKVAVVDMNEENGTRVVESLKAGGCEAIYIHCDVSKESDVEAMVDQTVAAFGGLDGAFNNAGIAGEFAPLADYPLETYDRVIAVNLTGVWLCMQQEIRHMSEMGGGTIVNTSSAAGLRGSPLLPAYSASKWGVIGLTKSAAKAYGSDGIRVNAICPGVIETPLTIASPLIDDPEVMEQLVARHALGRYGQPSEVGELVAWLLSDAASFMSGAAIPVDAGFTA
jgi:NAD(P)-dependent dehydrogenase (short-subunit alcohol dehydrogenase family)